MKNLMLMGLILGTVTVTGFANEVDGVYTTTIGRFEVSMIVEGERDGNAGILVGADKSILSRYIPETGFKHSTNVVLIKTPRQNILIDTGTGAGGIVIDKIKKLGVEPEQIDSVLITHLHGDHFGSLQKDGEATFPNAKIYLSKREHDHFTKTAPNQGAIAALAPYGKNVITFEPAELGARRMREVLPGITPIAAYGHTPGHTIFLVQDRRESILIIGDLLHVALVQFAVPEISATFDMDQPAAAVTRRQVLDYAAQNKIPVGGMHIVFPGMGNVSVEGSGFKITPISE